MCIRDRNNPDRDMGLRDQVMVQFTLDGEKVISVSMMDRQMALLMN